MAAGYNPNVACWSPYHGGMYAVVESVCRAAALGADPSKLRLSMQEYFPKLHDSKHWGQPLSALLGAYEACCELGLPAIGGKDSMSGTFMDLEVPPSLISFAVASWMVGTRFPMNSKKPVIPWYSCLLAVMNMKSLITTP